MLARKLVASRFMFSEINSIKDTVPEGVTVIHINCIHIYLFICIHSYSIIFTCCEVLWKSRHHVNSEFHVAQESVQLFVSDNSKNEHAKERSYLLQWWLGQTLWRLRIALIGQTADHRMKSSWCVCLAESGFEPTGTELQAQVQPISSHLVYVAPLTSSHKFTSGT